MSAYILLTIILALSAAFAYINHRFIKMPLVIGLFFLSTLLSIFIIASKLWNPGLYSTIKGVIINTDLSHYILDIMLGFLLFAGSLHTHWSDIKTRLKPIGLYAIGGVFFSTLIVASLLYGICHLAGIEINFIYCLIFGALISPTDPVAVMGILTKAQIVKKVESVIVGESLFNDAVGVVIFVALLETLQLGKSHIDFGQFGLLFLQEAMGGIAMGLILGFILLKLVRTVSHYETDVLLTIAFVMGGYWLCIYMHLSGALAMVIMGLMVGDYNKKGIAMSKEALEYVHKFWELIDLILNAILFISIALVMVVIDFKLQYVLVGLSSIVIVLLSRLIVVYLPTLLLPKFTRLNKYDSILIVWSGLRGGLSIALVLSLEQSEARDLLLVATYICVVFSVLVQGLSIRKLAKWLKKRKIKAEQEANKNITA